MGGEHLFNFRLDLSLTQQILCSHHSDIHQTNPGTGALAPTRAEGSRNYRMRVQSGWVR